MSIKIKFIIYFSVIFIIFGAFSSYTIFHSVSLNRSLNKKIPESVEIIRKSLKQSITAQLIRYDDEVLTQSARNYAFTGDKKWKDRYFEFVPKLDLRIKEAILYGNEEDQLIFNEINNANISLINLEQKAMDYVDNKNLLLAQKILESKEYSDQKNVYNNGLNKFLIQQGIEVDSADSVSMESLKESRDHLNDFSITGTYFVLILVFLFFSTLVFLYFVMFKTFMVPLSVFKKIAKEITNGNLNAKVDIKNKDEIGDFAIDFNKMTEELKKSLENINLKVEERTKELGKSKIILEKTLNDSERINKLMVGRELEMIKLKKELNDLKNKDK